MMSLNDIELSASGISSQISAGIPLASAARRMRTLQKNYASFWSRVAIGIENGRPISDFLSEQWPEAIVNSVKAGERSGKMEGVFAQIESTIAIQREIQGQVLQLLYPATFAAAGIAIFIFFMTSVLPSLKKSLGNGDKGFVFAMSDAITSFLEKNWIVTLVATLIIVMLIVSWLRDSDNRAKLVEMFLSVPILGEALKFLFFGIWCYYMALSHSSGSIPTPEGLVMSSAVLPKPLRSGLHLLAEESKTKLLGPSSDPDRLPSGDPRRAWPFYLHNAFLLADDSGLIDKELLRIAPSMIKNGTKMLKRVIFIANIVALILAGLLITGPLMAYYIQLGAALQASMRG